MLNIGTLLAVAVGICSSQLHMIEVLEKEKPNGRRQTADWQYMKEVMYSYSDSCTTYS